MVLWWPWPPLLTRKFQVRLVVRRIEGVSVDGAAAAAAAEVSWKGPKAALSSLRRTVRRNRTREEVVGEGGLVAWNEEFEAACTLTAHRENAFHPWEIAFRVLNVSRIWLRSGHGFRGLIQGPKNKESVLGTALLNLAEFVVPAAEDKIEINLPLILSGVASNHRRPSIHVSLKLSFFGARIEVALSLLELRASQDSSATMPQPILPALEPPSSGYFLPSGKDEPSGLKAGLRKVKILTDLMSTLKSKRTAQDDDSSEGRFSSRSDDAENAYSFDTDSLDNNVDEEDVEDGNVRKSFSYGTLASANYVGASFYSGMRSDNLIYYSHRSSDVGCSHLDDTMSTDAQRPVPHSSKRKILPWKRRKLSFTSPKLKGEPLLKKAYAEEGGDDIDYDRRMLSSYDESMFAWGDDDSARNCSSSSEFGDENFEIGKWELKELMSRDGHMKLATQVFFASIDQRSERAAGESACTALVAVVADWFQKNHHMMPIKSQFDCLIREGSLEWRNLCENQTFRERFPDKHFDLETVVQAKIRPLCVVPRKSFIGFFHPEDTDGNNGDDFEFLHGAMSFDGIWDEISQARSDRSSVESPQIYIVSWNDHFFVLKVEPDAYYIMDTLGERLYEGCHQAYILKFDESTTIHKIPAEGGETGSSEATVSGTTAAAAAAEEEEEKEEEEEEAPGNLLCRGKESCMEYIKNFLAAIPIRELQDDIRKGRPSSTPLHHRLQIEFHYTESSSTDASFAAALWPPTEAISD
ncbi:hypothetical protein B296_00033158 [Ensete ventricosum]|uniref:C2 NT-type domain-containing protein n=1 Tax=Ensete ventricosum TaxID=4639 RepID=A0A426XJQ5_ENSVE|nr:hypothetical protein B296_00033158 [Ensete ventricosum]